MGILTNKLPLTITIDGVDYPINTDFRVAIEWELMLQKKLEDAVTINESLHLFYGANIPPNINGALEKILWFYSGGKVVEKSGAEKAYFFDTDEEYIYSAILDQYKVDITEIEYLHWWKFLAMFKSLKEDNEISKIIGYRSIKITNKMTDEQKKFYKEMKKIHARPISQAELDEKEELDNQLMRKK